MKQSETTPNHTENSGLAFRTRTEVLAWKVAWCMHMSVVAFVVGDWSSEERFLSIIKDIRVFSEQVNPRWKVKIGASPTFVRAVIRLLGHCIAP